MENKKLNEKHIIAEDENGDIWLTNSVSKGETILGEYDTSNEAELALARELSLRGE